MEQEPATAPMPPKNKHAAKIITLIALTIAVVSASIFAGYFWASQNSANLDETTDTSELLFVMNGDATIAGDKLTMSDDIIEWFTNRPERDAGQMSPEAFTTAWESSDFNKIPPNAAFANLSAVVELSDPAIQGDAITFTFKIISGQLQDGTLPGTSLFIDAFPTTVNGQITDSVTQTSASDGYCWYDSAPWQVVATVKYIADTMTCDQRDEILQQFLTQLKLEDNTFAITITSDYPQKSTQWLCAGQVKPFNNTSPWQLENTSCDPTDATLKASFGFTVDGQTSLENQ